MQRKVRLKDVAERAGVAVNTASTILNRRPNSWASKETETRVFLAAKELGYRPSKTARALQSGRHHAIGLLIQDLANPFFATLAEEIESAVEQRGYDLIIANCRSSLVRETHLFTGMHEMEVDGAIVYLSDNEIYRNELAKRFTGDFPLVALGNGVPLRPVPVDCVLSDFTEGLTQAVTALLALGHRRFAFLSALAEGQADGDRPGLFQKLLTEQGVPSGDIDVLRCNHSVHSACETFEYFLKRRPVNRPTALVAMNDLSAIGAMRAALDAGLMIPRDLSIVGVDDVPLCAFLPIPLSSIRQRYRKIAAAAADMLITRISGNSQEFASPRQAIFPTHFIQRESVAAPAHG